MKKEVERIIEQTLMTNQYQAKKVHEWSSTIVENCVKNLQTFNKPFKYVGAQCVELGHQSCPFFLLLSLRSLETMYASYSLLASTYFHA